MTGQAAILGAFCTALSIIPAVRAEATSIQIVPAVQVLGGGPVDVGLRISGLTDLAAPSIGTFDLDLTFDAALLAVSSIAYGDPVFGDQLDLFGAGSITAATIGAGVVNLLELSLDSEADLNALQADEFTLVTIRFDVLGFGTSPLSLTVNTLGDAAGDPLEATVGTGSVTIEAPTAAVPEPTTSLLVGTGLLLAARRRCWSTRRPQTVLLHK